MEKSSRLIDYKFYDEKCILDERLLIVQQHESSETLYASCTKIKNVVVTSD
jgi:hypothetical protein